MATKDEFAESPATTRREQFWRLWAAVWLGRFIGRVSQLTGHGGSSLPGLWARRVEPQVLSLLAQKLADGVWVVTGTNGKTTTAALIRAMLEADGRPPAANASGSNMILGLTTALLQEVDWRLRPVKRLAVLEVDEATLPRASAEMRPRALLVTNVFRDQLDRYGEVSTTVDFIRRGLSDLDEAGVAVLNADDPQVATLGAAAKRVVWFGVSGPDTGGADIDGDARFCPHCEVPLAYTFTSYAHLGDYECVACGFRRPSLDVEILLDGAAVGGRGVRARVYDRMVDVPLPLSGTYNAYNMAAALALAVAADMDLEAVLGGVPQGRVAFGRMETLQYRERTVHLVLVKNPTGFNQVLETVAAGSQEAGDLLLCINDLYADGRDVSWLWDVDFERYAAAMPSARWHVSGSRADDMAVRLKYAGVPAERVERLADDPGQALESIASTVGGPVFVFPTYTAMLGLRRRLSRQGVVAHFREG